MAPISAKRITATTAMRARDVSRPGPEDIEAAEERPLRAEAPRRPQGLPADIARSVKGGKTESRRPGSGDQSGSGGSSPVAS